MADHEDGSFSGWGIFFLVLFILVVFGAVGWIFFTQWRARRLGLPAPSLNPFVRRRNQNRNAYSVPAPAPSGIKAWVLDKFDALRGAGRSSGGAYESTGYGVGGTARDRHGFGALDPDEAWDARVGNEYYEEQELGLQDPAAGPYAGSGYGQVVGAEVERGRSKSRQRELDQRYDEELDEMGLGRDSADNPFGDDAESSLRGVSPRPLADGQGGPSKGHKNKDSLGTDVSSPAERRSMFTENM